jgi:hypothetical protein
MRGFNREQLTRFICETCGTQFPDSERPPRKCLICSEERQYIGWSGQKWTTMSRMSRKYHNEVSKVETDIYSIVTRPEFAIGQRAFLVGVKDGNVLWDCLSYLDKETIWKIKKLGGIDLIAISHPHYYSSMVEWSETFGGAPIYVHELDRKWVVHSFRNIKFWKGVSISPVKGISLVNLGGHFDGGTVLHWNNGAKGEGVVLSGDIISVAMNRRWTSFMYSYPNLIPLSKAKIEQVVERMSHFRFEKLYSAFEGKEIERGAHQALKRSAKRYIDHISK